MRIGTALVAYLVTAILTGCATSGTVPEPPHKLLDAAATQGSPSGTNPVAPQTPAEQKIVGGDHVHQPPPAAMAHFNRGMMLIQQHKIQQSVDSFDAAITADPQFALAYAKRGFAYNWLRMYEKGIKDADKAIELDPGLAEAYRHRASAYSGLGQVKKSIEDVSRALQLNSHDFDSYWTRADAYATLKDFAHVTEDLSLAISCAPHQPRLLAQLYEHRAAAYIQLGKYDQAVKDCNEAIKQDPVQVQAFETRAHAYQKLGRKDLAAKDSARIQQALKN